MLLVAVPLSIFAQKKGVIAPSVVHRPPSAVSPQPSAVQDKFSRYEHYTMEQGLSNNSVSGIAQDDDGFLWFGTEEGLSRFDGERFSTFFKRSDGKGLAEDHITQLIAISGNRLLI
jgi:ligand-binding sensor domain-containing protein